MKRSSVAGQVPTQVDVARLSGVSRAAVSYVLSGRMGGSISISDETRQRIMQVAEELGYQPNAAAQSLRQQASHTIGVTISELSNPHSWEIVRGVEDEARKQGYQIRLLSSGMNPELEQLSFRNLLQQRIDGLVLMSTYNKNLAEDFQMLARRHSALVVLGRYSEDVRDIDTVTPGHGPGAVQMLQHLVDLGHRRIGFVLGVHHEPLGNERVDAYRQILSQHGVPVDEDLIEHCGTTIADGYQAARRLFERSPRPTAILSINDLLAIGVLHAAADAGLDVPGELSVAGFDDIDMAPFLNPSLTTVRVHAEEVGRAAVRLILDRLRDPKHPPQHIEITPQLMIRASTGPVTIS